MNVDSGEEGMNLWMEENKKIKDKWEWDSGEEGMIYVWKKIRKFKTNGSLKKKEWIYVWKKIRE